MVEAAVRVDGRDVLDAAAGWAALAAVAEPVVLLRAPRGLADEPSPLIPGKLVDQAKRMVPWMSEVLIGDTNHYLIVFGDREAAAVADEIARVTTAGGA